MQRDMGLKLCYELERLDTIKELQTLRKRCRIIPSNIVAQIFSGPDNAANNDIAELRCLRYNFLYPSGQRAHC